MICLLEVKNKMILQNNFNKKKHNGKINKIKNNSNNLKINLIKKLIILIHLMIYQYNQQSKIQIILMKYQINH